MNNYEKKGGVSGAADVSSQSLNQDSVRKISTATERVNQKLTSLGNPEMPQDLITFDEAKAMIQSMCNVRRQTEEERDKVVSRILEDAIHFGRSYGLDTENPKRYGDERKLSQSEIEKELVDNWISGELKHGYHLYSLHAVSKEIGREGELITPEVFQEWLERAIDEGDVEVCQTSKGVEYIRGGDINNIFMNGHVEIAGTLLLISTQVREFAMNHFGIDSRKAMEIFDAYFTNKPVNVKSPGCYCLYDVRDVERLYKTALSQEE